MIEGLFSLIIGILWLVFTIKNPQKKPSGIAEDWRGLITGGSLVFLGIMLIIRSCS